jgi:hypothetical protein
MHPASLAKASAGFNGYVRPQMSFRGFLGFSHQLASGPPQQKSEDYKQRIRDLHSPPEYRPKFGSVIAALFCLLLASLIDRRGWRMLGGLIAAYALFGLLFGFDLWSLLS